MKPEADRKEFEATMPTQRDMEAFKRGEAAFSRGADRDANPYPGGSDYFMWHCGWTSARVDEAQRIRQNQ